jgi:phospholipid/cholesterol/gamma-HCH transport system substrate-binding protein
VADRAEANLENLEGLTEPLGESGPQIVANVERSSENLDEILTQLTAFTSAMNEGQGTLGQLVHGDELYGRIDQVMANVEEVSKRLLPIVNDVRILTDKLARDPSQLGVKGALDRRPGGIKTNVDW